MSIIRWDATVAARARKTLYGSLVGLPACELIMLARTKIGLAVESLKLNGDEQLVLGSVPVELYGAAARDWEPPDFEQISGTVLVELELLNMTKHPITISLELRRRVAG